MRFHSITVAVFAACGLAAQAGFLYHDSATTTGGEFSATNFPIGHLKNAGHDSHLDTESTADFNDSYATTSGASYPVTITLNFNNAVDLSKFYLWNHSNNNSATSVNSGVKDFTLRFFDAPSGGGSQIGSDFVSTASAAPNTTNTDYAAQIFDLAGTYSGVRSVELVIANRISGTGFVAIRELGFEGVFPPTDFIYHDSATTNGGTFNDNAGYAIGNLKNGGYTSPSSTENANVGAINLSYATKNPPTGGYPVTITLEFDGIAYLEAFHLWNHSNSGSGTAIDQGVNAFSLTFYDGPGGTGAQIGSTFNGNAAKAPATGNYPAESFTFTNPYTGVRSIVMTADNHNPSSNFVAMREIGFTGTVTPIPPSASGKVVVYLVGGQSNADGYGITSQLSTELQSSQPDIDFYHGNGGGNSPLAANQWINLQPGSGSMTGNAGGFGPELNFGIGIHQALGSENARIALIKHTRGGTSLHTDWFPGGDATTAGDGADYQAFQTTVNNALAALTTRYPGATVLVEGMVWHQGESDATATHAGNYQTNLTNFIADVRATYGSSLKFGIVQLSDNQTSLDPTSRSTVKTAQAAVATADPLSYLVTTDDLPMGGSSTIHFGTSGNLTIGTRLATGMRQVPINDGDPNSLDDDWEEFYWGIGNTGQDPDGDDDKDGLTNLEEFLWLTNPLVSNVISPALQNTPSLSITWPSSPARRYLIEASPDLNQWQRLDSFVPGSAGVTTSYELPLDPAATKRFVRVGVQR